MQKGFVYLVGAGPGRSDLITVRGAELLGAADCVICDRLANPALLNYARHDAEIIHVPKRTGDACFTQQRINKLLIEKASSGQTVVRLKGGDPWIFGRAAEEAAVLAEAEIDFEIIPGVTAGIAAAAYAGVILTDRNYSSQVVFVTGREADRKQTSNIDWQWLAEFAGTIVFYMAMGNLDFIVKQLTKAGMNQAMPAVVIADATLPTQRVVKASLSRITEKCEQQKIEPPAIVIIGPAADSNVRLNWFTKKPLFDRNIVVTRSVSGNADFANRIIAGAGNPIKFATIKIKPLTRSARFLQTLAELAEYDWVIFTSANGVTIFFEALQNFSKDAGVFGSAKIAAVGNVTAAKLAEFGIKADFVPSVFTGCALGKQLIGYANLQGKRVLLLRAERASKKLLEVLSAAGAKVNDVAVYTTVTLKGECSWLVERISKGRIDWLTFASPSSARGFFEQIQPDLVNSSDVGIASIGPATSEQLKNLGLKVDVEAAEHTINGLLTAIEKSEKCKT